MLPAIRDYGVRDQFHGPEFLVQVVYERSVAEEDRGPVIVVVAVRRKG